MNEKELRAGPRPVLETLRAGRPVNRIVLARGVQDVSVREIRRLARARGIPVTEVEKAFIDRQAGSLHHQGVLAWVAPREYVEVEDLLELARVKGESPCLVALDGLEDPQNLGSIIRTVEGVGAHGVIIPKRRSVQLNATVARTSSGAVDLVSVARVTNLPRTLELLKKQGCWVVGTSGDASLPYYDADLRGGLVIVIGSEGKGLSRLVQEKCDLLIRLPMQGQLNSLNASVAAGVVLYEALRQRQITNTGQNHV
ncbi:MAG: 23S rRNA (guanosine(2251)-2'-O)-methyltransferase RlmB [Syntrophomonadaceae bacterium]|nr:23S rRNA (guanosine(2251)-2'-O)-methyltransferase RlmB [Syntrophomonadaceae bacterium]